MVRLCFACGWVCMKGFAGYLSFHVHEKEYGDKGEIYWIMRLLPMCVPSLLAG